MVSRRVPLIVGLVAVLAPGVARALPQPTVASEAAPAPAPDTAAGERSDGRLDPLPEREWRRLPQVLLFPFRALFWLLQWPIGGYLRIEDRYQLMARGTAAVTWSGGTRGLRPAFYYSTVTVPEFGLKYFDHRTLGVDTRLDLTATVGGGRYVYSELVLQPTRIGALVTALFDIAFDRRADLIYNGLGAHTDAEMQRTRFLMNSLEGYAVARVRPVSVLSLYVSFGAGFKRFGDGDYIDGNPAISVVYDTSTIPGFGGITFVRGGAGFTLDTRNSPLRGATGLVLRGAFDYSYDVGGDHVGYERVSGSVGVPIDLWQRTHVLWLAVTTQLAFRNGGPVPFSELPTLGGPEDLRGFRFQQFRDYSSFVATAEYRWPVWMWVDGTLFVDYGGVFGQSLAGFGANRMQPDIGAGLRLLTSQHFFVRAQIAYGFDQGWNFTLSGNTR